MQVAFYKGRTRLFNRLTAWWLRGAYSHCELVLGTGANGLSISASSSFLDGGVRIKHMALDPAHWDIVPVAGCERQAWAWRASWRGCWGRARGGGFAARPWRRCWAFRMRGGLIRAACMPR